MGCLDVVADWPVTTVAAAVVGPEGIRDQKGSLTDQFALASVTKLLVARAALVALDEGAIELDTAAGPPGATIEHLLAHASGLSMLSDAIMAAPGVRRVYSNYGFAVTAHAVEDATAIQFGTYLKEAVLDPLSMNNTALPGGADTAGYGATSTVADLAAFAGDLFRPQIVSPELHRRAVSVTFPGLDGVLPGYGVQRPNDWGLGFELKSTKDPHWTGSTNSPATYGHFGGSGTFMWIDPLRELGLIVLTDRDFDDWAKPLWPTLSDTVLAEYA